MNVIGQVVEHKSLGEGKICDHKIRERESHILSLISLVTKKNSNSQIFLKTLLERRTKNSRLMWLIWYKKRKI